MEIEFTVLAVQLPEPSPLAVMADILDEIVTHVRTRFADTEVVQVAAECVGTEDPISITIKVRSVVPRQVPVADHAAVVLHSIRGRVAGRFSAIRADITSFTWEG